MQIPHEHVQNMRNQGIPDHAIQDELSSKGYDQTSINAAINHSNTSSSPSMPQRPMGQSSTPDSNIYERIEEITEQMIDERWDELIKEVRKIVEWKAKIEETQLKLNKDLEKLKEDFKTLHTGVLGKVEEYDTRMRDVGTELKAVGKVFKDVIPQFVENVKELKEHTQNVKNSALKKS
jgi:iron-sulfur cluster repair protein YtfE (RIC family)